MQVIQIRGARVHNLQNVELDLPRNRLVVFTGVSGSGKSSLAFDVIFAEGQRRFLESLSVGERQALPQLPRPDVDALNGLPPTVSIDQRRRTGNRRGTLATLTGIMDFLRLLLARAGQAHCPHCNRPVSRQSQQAIVDQILSWGERKKVMLLAPWIRGQKGEHRPAFQAISQAGFVRARVDGRLVDATDPPPLAKTKPHDIEAIIDRIILKDGIRARLQESVELALKHGGGSCLVSWQDGETWKDRLFSERFACPDCQCGFAELEPRSFSFNSPYGACPECNGLGVLHPPEDQELNSSAQVVEAVTCPVCGGERLNAFSRAVTIGGCTFGQFNRLNVAQAREFLIGLPAKIAVDEEQAPAERANVIARTVPAIARRLQLLIKVGLDYLTLDRPADSLSGGEFQRARLAACLGTGLRGACYVLDEPTTGLHPRDVERLIGTLEELRDQGNTVLVVEHDVEVMRRADWLVDFGPGAGRRGGRIMAAGPPGQVAENPDSPTAPYLKKGSGGTGSASVLGGIGKASVTQQHLILTGARRHNLKDVTLRLPVGWLTCVTGVSGSGKSSLISQTLVPALRRVLAGQPHSSPDFDELQGAETFSRLVEIDQAPLGRSALSNPATYSGLWEEVRKVFAKTREARLRGFKPTRFSFNSRDGRCPACKGKGTRRVDLHFLPDVDVECPTCQGARFNPQTLSVRFRGKHVAQMLSLPIEEARDLFENVPKLAAILSTFIEVGLGYLVLGQSANTLSGGEAQRVKLATELSRQRLEPTLFVLDEPTSGLHPADVERLIQLLRRLVREGHTVVVVEHHVDVMRAADWIIDLGPDGGEWGGTLLAEGAPEQIARENSPTGQALRVAL